MSTEHAVGWSLVDVLPHWVRPNHITGLRLLCVPIVCILYATAWLYAAASTYYWIFGAVCIWIFIGVTDWADGELARRRRLESQWGKRLDEFADKVSVWAALVLLWLFGEINLNPTPVSFEIIGAGVVYHADTTPVLFVAGCVIVVRDIVMTALRQCIRTARTMPVLWLAKWKTAIQFVAIALLLTGSRHASVPEQNVFFVGGVLLVLSAIIAVWTAVHYLWYSWRISS